MPTERGFTGQPHDASGLVYMNARYYDPVVGQFASPDTVVPDPTVVMDYNRYLYARGNPLKYNDPTGHYSNEEIMQHYGCSDWACVEAIYGDGLHAGLWGWLHVLQQASDGDSVMAANIAYLSGHAGSTNSELWGTFQRAGGVISVALSHLRSSGATYHYGAGAVMSEMSFASFAANNSALGVYQLSGKTSTAATSEHKHLHFDASRIDYGGLAVGVLKGGKDWGPMIAKAPSPWTKAVGAGYTIVGRSTVAITDYAIPTIQLMINGDAGPLVESLAVNIAEQSAREHAPSVAPYVGPAYDISKAIAPGFCFNTGCPH